MALKSHRFMKRFHSRRQIQKYFLLGYKRRGVIGRPLRREHRQDSSSEDARHSYGRNIKKEEETWNTVSYIAQKKILLNWNLLFCNMTARYIFTESLKSFMFGILLKICSNIHIVVGCLLAIIFGKIISYHFFTFSTLKELIELSKCPACFGVTLCPEFMKNQISINGFSLYTKLVNSFGPGNTLFGLYNDHKVVIKKLGQSWEISEVEDKICLHMGLNPGCNVANILWHPDNFYDVIKQLLPLPAIETEISKGGPEFNNLHLCPSTEHLDTFLQNFFERNKGINLRGLHINIWMMLLLNPEPLILQAITEEDGWPVPKYYGACGRVVVEEYAGDTLTGHYNSPWLKRLDIALQLLIAATHFTQKHPRFSFYLTDISPDNIAVDGHGKVKFIDLENIIVVDRTATHTGNIESWHAPHVSESFECPGCYLFSAHDICSHNVSDHNYYVICQHILDPDTSTDLFPGGLLHDIPSSVQKSHPELVDVIYSCVQPDLTKGNTRFTAIEKLKNMFSDILKMS